MSSQATEAWTEDEVLDNVRRVVRALMSIRDVEIQWLADGLGLRRTAAYNRLSRERDSRFTVAEIYRMARLFDVPASVFFEPAEDLLGGIRKARFLEHPTRPPALRLVRPPSAAA